MNQTAQDQTEGSKLAWPTGGVQGCRATRWQERRTCDDGNVPVAGESSDGAESVRARGSDHRDDAVSVVHVRSQAWNFNTHNMGTECDQSFTCPEIFRDKNKCSFGFRHCH